MDKYTPLYQEHQKLNAKIAPFAGWMMPINYPEGIIAEHNWTRTSASLFDICHMGEFRLKGDPQKMNLGSIVTQDIAGMAPGICRYGFILNEQGGIIDDLVVYRQSESDWMIVVNAARIQVDFSHFKAHLTGHILFEDVSQQTGKLDLQGPLSRDVLDKVLGVSWERSLKYYRCGWYEFAGSKNIISRTGYTGELGFELYVNSANVRQLWQALLSDHRVKPAGLGARDTLRLEMCYPLYGQDMDESLTPLEADLERYVDFSKDFIGREALLKASKNISRKLRFFACDSRRAPRHGFGIFSQGRRIGDITSGSFAPSLGYSVGMGYAAAAEEPQGCVILSDGKTQLQGCFTDKPFYKNGTARKPLGDRKTKV